MSVPVWIEGLPANVLTEGWGVRPEAPLRRTEMDDGGVAVTRRLHRTRTVLPVRWEMTDTQWRVFLDFWLVDLAGGQAWFDCPLTLGRSIQTLRVRFVQTSPPFQVTTPAPGYKDVATELEINDLPALAPATRAAFEAQL